MKLFENKVGRPSNEMLKKRKIFKISIIVSMTLVLSLGIFMLFKVTVSLLTYLVSPDKINDKEEKR